MLQYHELNNFDDMNWFEKLVTGFKMLWMSADTFALSLLILAVGVLLVFYIIVFVRGKKLLYGLLMVFIIEIFAFILCSWTIAYKNIGVGYYETEIKANKIKNVENIDKSYKSYVSIKDADDETVKLLYKGKKINKNDKITIRTNRQLVDKDNSREIEFDLDKNTKYTYLYNGKELEVTQINNIWDLD